MKARHIILKFRVCPSDIATSKHYPGRRRDLQVTLSPKAQLSMALPAN